MERSARSRNRSLLMLLPIVIAGTLLSAPGCSRGNEPSPSESELREDDQRRLERLVEADVRASRAMKSSDEAATRGDVSGSIDILEKQARPALDQGLQAAGDAKMKTTWGTARRDELAALLAARKAEVPAYEEAIRSGDPEKMIRAMQAQAALERRAIAAVASLRQPR